MEALGKHAIFDFFDCRCNFLDSADQLKAIMTEAAIVTGANVIEAFFHKFNPYGVSGTVIISESHLSIHTWPELGFASIDVFTCGEIIDPWKAFSFLKEQLQPEHTTQQEIKRGLFDSKNCLPKYYNVKPTP